MNSALTRRQLFSQSGFFCGGLALASCASHTEAAAAEHDYKFNFSLNTGTIRGQKLTIIEEIDVAAKAGYDGIEPWVSSIAKHVESGGSLKDLRKRCEDSGLKVIDAIGFPRWIIDDDTERAKGVEQFKRDMEMVAQIGGKYIAAPPTGANKAGIKLDLDRAAERYRTILEIGRQIGIIPQLEIWGSSANINHLAEALYVTAKSGDPDACILADVFHMYKAGVAPAALKLLGRQAVHVFHMNDYPADPPREKAKDSDRVWPGDGIAPLKEILSNFAANHCQLMLSVETFNPAYYKMPALDAAKTGLAKMKAAVANAGLA